MKKIIATLTVFVAAALGAQGQTTTNFPITGTFSFSGLTFNTVTATLESPEAFTRARLLVGVSGIPDNGAEITVTAFSLTGQGITSSLNFSGSRFYTAGDNTPNPLDVSTYQGPASLALNNNIQSWNSSNNTASFNISINGSLSPGTQLYYAVQYSFGSQQINTAFGNVNLVAVPEPSTYVAAAGLLGLFLWPVRRHLFKLAACFPLAANSSNRAV